MGHLVKDISQPPRLQRSNKTILESEYHLYEKELATINQVASSFGKTANYLMSTEQLTIFDPEYPVS